MVGTGRARGLTARSPSAGVPPCNYPRYDLVCRVECATLPRDSVRGVSHSANDVDVGARLRKACIELAHSGSLVTQLRRYSVRPTQNPALPWAGTACRAPTSKDMFSPVSCEAPQRWKRVWADRARSLTFRSPKHPRAGTVVCTYPEISS